MAPKRSAVWRYFEAVSAIKSRCLSCNKFVMANSNTTNLKAHLKTHHHHLFLKLRDSVTTHEEIEVVNLIEDERALPSSELPVPPSEKAPDTSHTSITSPPESAPTSSRAQEPMRAMSNEDNGPTPTTSGKRQTQLRSRFHVPSKTELTKVTEGIANLLAVTGTPYLFVENEAFRKFMAIVSPHYKVPCRTTFSERYIPRLFTTTKDTIRLMLRDVPFLSLTTDGWTGCNHSQFISVTATFIDVNWSLKTLTLACRVLNDSHTGKHVAALIQDVLDEYSIDLGRISAVTTDRGSNMVNAVVAELKKPHIACFAHVLNSFIKKVEEHQFVAAVLRKVRDLYNIFAFSSHARRALTDIQRSQELATNKMPSTCPTRWWSEIEQLKFVVKYERALFTFCNEYADGEHQHTAITTNDMKMVNVILSFMVDFERIQKTLGGETSVTGSLVLPVIKKAESIINSIGANSITVPGTITFKRDVQKLYKEVLAATYSTETSHLDMATYLDPRFDRSNVDVMNPIIRLDASIAAHTIEVMEPVQPKQPRNDLQIFFEDEDEEMTVPSRTIDDDIRDYAIEPKISLAECPLRWWKRKVDCAQMPFLAPIVRKYLCMTATSVPSERVFSVGGNTLTKERFNLSDEHTEQLIFLTKNKHLIKW